MDAETFFSLIFNADVIWDEFYDGMDEAYAEIADI